jgi:hypothetical protein
LAQRRFIGQQGKRIVELSADIEITQPKSNYHAERSEESRTRRNSFFAEFPLSEANVLNMTRSVLIEENHNRQCTRSNGTSNKTGVGH